jgi:quercetin dioxygenase-like cupin family protein
MENPNPLVTRAIVLDVPLDPSLDTGRMQVRRITLAPGAATGAHVHNGPVFGNIVEGSAVYQIEGEPETVLKAGDVFYEPADTVITRFDATDEGVVFFGYFPVQADQEPTLTPLPPRA